MGTRWKGKSAEAKALADPMSKIISQLSSSLTQSRARGLLTGCSVLVAVETEQIELLTRACFGRPIINAEKEKQWFQLDMEEAFYLQYYFTKTFPYLFKAYSHLRKKNWVVRPGSQYGVDFVAYRHHPSFVHSEYAVLVSSEAEDTGRLRVWSDFYCTIRLCGSVAKTLLVLLISVNMEMVIWIPLRRAWKDTQFKSTLSPDGAQNRIVRIKPALKSENRTK